jgi:hypothetical protein
MAAYTDDASVDSLAERGIKATNISMQPHAQRLEELSRLVDAGEIAVRLECTLPLERAPEPLEESKTGRVQGRSYTSSTRGR